jgi:hypothetical protein
MMMPLITNSFSCTVGTDRREIENCLRSDDGVLSKQIDATQLCLFSLKLLQTSANAQWRLLFVVKYYEGDTEKTEEMISDPFVVISNAKKTGL